ncbi:hypothetical protein ACERII_04465 [Evansella sp. AB-rgal1]
MKGVKAYYSFIEGSSHDIGRMQGEEIKKTPDGINRMEKKELANQ